MDRAAIGLSRSGLNSSLGFSFLLGSSAFPPESACGVAAGSSMPGWTIALGTTTALLFGFPADARSWIRLEAKTPIDSTATALGPAHFAGVMTDIIPNSPFARRTLPDEIQPRPVAYLDEVYPTETIAVIQQRSSKAAPSLLVTSASACKAVLTLAGIIVSLLSCPFELC
jgi:hypothetical protein